MTAMVYGSIVLMKYCSETEFPTNRLRNWSLTYWRKGEVHFAIFFLWDLLILSRLSCYSHLLSSSKPFRIQQPLPWHGMGWHGAVRSHLSKRLSLEPPDDTVARSSSYVRGTVCTPTSPKVTLLQRHRV